MEHCVLCIPAEVCQEHVCMDLSGYIESICIIQYYNRVMNKHTHTHSMSRNSFELLAQGFGPQTLRMERAAQCLYFECKPDAKGHGASRGFHGMERRPEDLERGQLFLTNVGQCCNIRLCCKISAKCSLRPCASMKPCSYWIIIDSRPFIMICWCQLCLWPQNQQDGWMAETVLTASRKITRSLVPVATGQQLVPFLSPRFFSWATGFPCLLLCASDSLFSCEAPSYAFINQLLRHRPSKPKFSYPQLQRWTSRSSDGICVDSLLKLLTAWVFPKHVLSRLQYASFSFSRFFFFLSTVPGINHLRNLRINHLFSFFPTYLSYIALHFLRFSWSADSWRIAPCFPSGRCHAATFHADAHVGELGLAGATRASRTLGTECHATWHGNRLGVGCLAARVHLPAIFVSFIQKLIKGCQRLNY